jgi:hypothetical protein
VSRAFEQIMAQRRSGSPKFDWYDKELDRINKERKKKQSSAINTFHSIEKASSAGLAPIRPKLSSGPRIGLSPTSQATQTAQPIQPIKKSSTWDMVKAFDLKGLGNQALIGIRHGAAETGSVEQDQAMANLLSKSTLSPMAKIGQQQLAGQQTEQNYLRDNPVNTLPAMLGKELFMLPAWVGGERLVGAAAQGIGKLAPRVASNVNKLPGFVRGGLTDTAAYGSFVAPIETIREGGNFQTLAEKEKNLPGVFLGGTALRGIGAGAKLAKDVKGEGGSLKQALAMRKANLEPNVMPVNPLESVQGAYRNPATLRDAQASAYSKLDFDNPMTTTTRTPIKAPLRTEPLTYEELLTQRRTDAQAAFGGPIGRYKIKETITPQQRSHNARQAELEEAFRDYPIGAVDTPIAHRTLQEGIDASLGIGRPKENITQADVEAKFGKPIKTYRVNTDINTDIAEIESRMAEIEQGAATMVKQANKDTKIDSLVKRVREKGGIAPSKTGAFASEYRYNIPATFKNKNGRPLDEVADELGVSARELIDAIVKNPKANPKTTGTGDVFSILNNDAEYNALAELLDTLKSQIPGKKLLPIKKGNIKLKPRELKPKLEPIQPQRQGLSGTLPKDTAPRTKPNVKLKRKEIANPQTIEPRLTERVLPNKPERLIWTNREGIEGMGGSKPVKSITEENAGQFGKAKPIEKAGQTQPIQPPKPVADTKQFWTSVRKELNDKGEMTPFSVELLKREIKEGKLDISKLSNRDEVATMLGMDLTKFGKNTANAYETPLVGLPKSQSDIVIGKKKERLGFKESLKKFYTKVVNTQQPIVDVGKVDGSDIGKLASNTRNVSGIVDYNFTKGMVNKNGDKVGESLQSVVGAIPKGKEKDFWSYMSHRHNVDRAREGKPVQANYTPEMSDKAVRQFEAANPEYKAVGDNIVKWIDQFMETWGVDTGIVDKELYQGLRQTYKNYFPTQRDFSELEKSIPDNISQKFADQRTPIRKATGSERDIIDPTENIMNLVNRTIRAAKYNEVGQSLLKSVRNNPEKLKPFAEEITVKEGMFANTDNVISVLENGKAKYLRINDKALLDAMNGLPKSIGNVPYVTALTNGIKSLITQKNPLFAIRNISRDIPTAYVYGSEKNPFKFAAGLIGAGKDIITQGPRLQKYKAVGGGGANFFNSGDVTKSAKEITGRINPIKKIALKPIKAIEAFNNLTESTPRLAEFNRVLKKTGDVNKALYAANEVTVNFSRGGNISKTIDKGGGMYVGASIQGIDRFFRGFKDPKTAVATLAKAGIAITAPDVALYMINKDNPYYQQLDNRSKDTYFQIPNYGNVDENGNPKTFIKIPKSRELGVLFGSLFERIGRSMAGQEDSFKGFSKSVATNFAPANPLESSLYSPLLLNLPKNKDFADRPIVPQAMLMDKRSPYLQYDDKSTELSKWFANLIKDVPMPEKVKGVVGSPKVLDYLVKSYTGVVGQLGIPLATPGGSLPKALKTQFTSDPVFSNQASTNFYDRLNKLSTTATDKNLVEKIPSKKLTNEENIKNSMQGVSSALSRATKQINNIQASDSQYKEDEIIAIRRQMLELMLEANSASDAKAMQKVENRANKVFKK